MGAALDWRAYLTLADEVYVYCPDCAEREFGGAGSSAGRMRRPTIPRGGRFVTDVTAFSGNSRWSCWTTGHRRRGSTRLAYSAASPVFRTTQ